MTIASSEGDEAAFDNLVSDRLNAIETLIHLQLRAMEPAAFATVAERAKRITAGLPEKHAGVAEQLDKAMAKAKAVR